MGLLRALRFLRPAGRRRRMLHQLVLRADRARDARSFVTAAEGYEALLREAPDDVDVHVQCGHMWKEAGRMAAARQHYLTAQSARPNDAELTLQLGHFHKTVGEFEEARRAYAQALALRPGWSEAERELAGLPGPAAAPGETAEAIIGLAATLLPTADAPRARQDGIELLRFGRPEDGRWGMRRTLRGVEAIRGYCIDEQPITELRLLLDAKLVLSHGLARPTAVSETRQKSVFNAWIDTSALPRGLHYAHLQLIDGEGGIRSVHDYVVIADPVREEDAPGSDAVVTLDPADDRSPEEQIRSRPSMIRPATRALFPEGVRSVLVMRTDQLGDLVASIPALRRLRALLPEARLVGLLTAANADLAATLGLFDEQIVIDFPHDFALRRRTMPAEAQRALKAQLAPYRFDIAIDLASSDMSRPLLALSGATFLHGFPASEPPRLDGRAAFDTPDRFVGMDQTPHSAKPLALVEALGAALATNAPVIRRTDLPMALLKRFGIASETRFILLHGGARLAFSRWPHFATLAQALLARTGYSIVMMLEDGDASALPADLVGSDRVHVIEGRTSFDEFDALISHAGLVIGNDSGPKHLAALRGTKVITIFTARVNWAEWGQENIGWIISRRVPCAGCAIFHEPDDCGKDFACIRDIRVEEVLDTALAALG